MSEPEFTWWAEGGGALLDQIICSCGWKSATFFDGQEYAYAQWKKHIKTSHTKVPGHSLHDLMMIFENASKSEGPPVHGVEAVVDVVIKALETKDK